MNFNINSISIEKKIPQIHMESQRALNSQNNLEKERAGGLTLLISKHVRQSNVVLA